MKKVLMKKVLNKKPAMKACSDVEPAAGVRY